MKNCWNLQTNNHVVWNCHDEIGECVVLLQTPHPFQFLQMAQHFKQSIFIQGYHVWYAHHFQCLLQIKNGKVHFTSDAGVAGKVERSIPEAYVADGHWHTFRISKNGSTTVLSVDRLYNRDIVHLTQDFGGLEVLTISLGGIPPNQAHHDTQTGKCVWKIRSS